MPKIFKVKEEPNSENIDRPTRKPKLWAVIVGVNQYQDPDIKNLEFCANDGVGLASALQKVALQKVAGKEAIFDTVEIGVYCDLTISSFARITEPKIDNILTALDIFGRAQPEDTVLFYFSGHGDYDEKTKQTILCVTETEIANLSETGLLIKTVLAKITASAAKQQLIWLDACHSGGMTGQLIDAILQETKNNPKIHGITACDRHEESLEVTELGHGLFTYNLIKGLEGGLSSPEIKVDDLYQYVYYQTLEYIDRYNQLAKYIDNKSDITLVPFKPQRIAIGSGEFILGYSSSLSVDRNSRGALVFDGVQPSEAAIDLSRILGSKGRFPYQPYANREESLQDSISALLRSPNTTTALLYLKGKLEVTDLGVVFFVFSDGTKIPREWLAQELADSPVEQQIIILDCCQTANINRQIKILKQPNKSQCIVAASTENNLLEEEFRKIIENHSVKGLTGTNLINQISQTLRGREISAPKQRSFYRSAPKGEIIDVILPQAQQLNTVIVDRNYCPYKGLAAFTKEDKDFFFGRNGITQTIIGQLEKTSFLPVVGASGSGKSSIVQAGVVPTLLDRGLFNSEDSLCKPCQVWIIRTGDRPLQSLALALSNKNQDSDYLEGILNLGIESFVAWLRQQPLPMGILVIDQFEELFTQASEVQHSLFLDLILGAIEYAGDRFKVIITLRNDFMASCLAIPQLGEIVKQNPIFVPSYLTENEYRQIITAPATRAGLSVQPELVDVLVTEVSTQKGALPLLEFTLEQLWQNRDRGSLSLRVYQEKIGGIKKVLQERADSIYQKLTLSQKECAEWIFTQLVSLGEGQEDTRRRRNLSELVVPKYDQELITSTLNILRDSRLIVTSNQEGDLITAQQAKGKTKGENKEEASESLQLSIDSEVTVEIAHEILIRNWQQLRWWLDENREQIRLRERIEEKASEWKVNEEKTDYLIRGAALAQAEEFYIKSADELTNKSQKFISQSIEDRDKQAKLAKRRRRQIINGLTGGIVTLSMVAGAALWQLRRATISEINALNNSAETLLASNQELDALVTGLNAARKTKNSWFGVNRKTQIKILANLQNIFYQVQEFNSLELDSSDVEQWNVNNNGKVTQAKYSSTLWSKGKTTLKSLNTIGERAKISDSSQVCNITAVVDIGGNQKIIELHNRKGKILRTLKHIEIINQIKFSPDAKVLASAGDDGIVKLWNCQGEILHTLDHTTAISSIKFSPDGKILASGDFNGTIKLWSLKGQLLHTFKGQLLHTFEGHTREPVNDIVFSPNGTSLASIHYILNSKSKSIFGILFPLYKTIHILSAKSGLLHTFEGHKEKILHGKFSPDGKLIITTNKDGIVKLWNQQGNEITKFSDKLVKIKQAKFSQSGKTLAIGSEDGTIKLWNQQGNLLHTLKGHKEAISILSFSPNGQFLASVDESGTIKLWNGQGILVKTLNSHKIKVSHITFSPDSKIIASSDKSGTIKLWNTQQENLLTRFDNKFKEVVISPDSKIIASVDTDNKKVVKLWNRQGKTIATIENNIHEVTYIAFSHDNKTIATGDSYGTIKLWKRSGALITTLKGDGSSTKYIAFSPDNTKIISYSFNNNKDYKFYDIIKLWSIDGKIIKIYKGKTRFVKPLFYNIQKGFIVDDITSDNVKETGLFLWSWKGELIKKIKHKSQLDNLESSWRQKIFPNTFEKNIYSFSLDGEMLVESSAYDLYLYKSTYNFSLYSYNRGAALKRFKSFKAHGQEILSVAFNPQNNFIASSSKDTTIKLWTKKGELITTLNGHSDDVTKITFSPDGKTLISTSEDNTSKLWSLDLDEVMIRGCDWVKDYLVNNPNVSEEDRKICEGI